MEKEILIDQLNDKVAKGITVIIELYSRLLEENITEEEYEGLLETCTALLVIFKSMRAIQQGDIEPYKDLIYKLAQD